MNKAKYIIKHGDAKIEAYGELLKRVRIRGKHYAIIQCDCGCGAMRIVKKKHVLFYMDGELMFSKSEDAAVVAEQHEELIMHSGGLHKLSHSVTMKKIRPDKLGQPVEKMSQVPVEEKLLVELIERIARHEPLEINPDNVPAMLNYLKKLIHHKDSTCGLYATDKEEVYNRQPKDMFQIEFNK